jgi:hypothetical protein
LDIEIPNSKHAFTAEFVKTGDHKETMSAVGTLTLYIEIKQVDRFTIITQPGFFCPVGDGLCVGRDSVSPASQDYTAPFRFNGGIIEKFIIDVSGDHFIDHEKGVLAYLMQLPDMYRKAQDPSIATNKFRHVREGECWNVLKYLIQEIPGKNDPHIRVLVGFMGSGWGKLGG